jgi:histidinol-phosphate aminotransferase
MKNIDQLVRKQIKNVEEINWGEIPENNPYRLLWGENQQLLPIYKEALTKEIQKINLYPSATKLELRQKIAAYNKVISENIVLTNGSDDALELIAKVFLNQNDEVLIPSPSYPCFSSVSQMMGAKIIFVKLEKDFSLNSDKLLKEVDKKTKIIWIANPNNPTGNVLLTKKQIENIAKQVNCLLVIDECYFELGEVTAAGLVKDYPNIVVTRSFSKVFGLAGARLGYIIANRKVTEYLNRLQQTNQVFGINRFAYAAGIAIMNDPLLIKKSLKKFKELKQSFEKLLQEIPLEILPTQTTFCLVKLPKNTNGKDLKEKLAKQDIFIKDCSIYPTLGKQYIYLGIPQIRFQKKFVLVMRKALEELSC